MTLVTAVTQELLHAAGMTEKKKSLGRQLDGLPKMPRCPCPNAQNLYVNLTCKRDFADVIKNLKIRTFYWIIWA